MIRSAATAAILLAFCAIAPAGATPDDLLARMAALNANLHSYTATLHANAALKTFPFLSAQVVGTYYFKEPDKEKVEFTGGVPGMAQQFDKLYAHIEAPAQWDAVYQVTVVSDDGTTTAYRLVPRKRGNIDHIDAKANDKTATVDYMRWNYDNGGYAEMYQHYSQVQGFTLVTSQTGHIQEPGYTADVTSSIDGYKLNVPIPDSRFAAGS
jgi:hypothetical protein